MDDRGIIGTGWHPVKLRAIHPGTVTMPKGMWRVKRETCEKGVTWTDWIPTRLARPASLACPARRPYEVVSCYPRHAGH